MLNNYTDHEGQRTGVNVGMVDTAVLLVCIFPVGRTFMLLTEFLRSSSITSQAAEKERNLYIHSSIPTTETSTWELVLYSAQKNQQQKHMLWNKHCYTISFSFVLLLVEALLEQWRLLSTSPLSTAMCWQILCHKQVPTSTSLLGLIRWDYLSPLHLGQKKIPLLYLHCV